MAKNALITGWGFYAPSRVMTNAELERIVDTSDEWITSRTGIKERRIASDEETNSFMSARAARAALEKAHLRAHASSRPRSARPGRVRSTWKRPAQASSPRSRSRGE